MDIIKDIYEAWGARIKSNVFGSIILAFIAVNWNVLYFIVFADVRVETKFSYFDVNTNWVFLYLLPVLIGATLALILPYINYGALRFVSKAVKDSKLHQDELSHERLTNKINFEIKRNELRNKLKEQRVVEGEIEDRASKIEDDSVRQAALADLDKIESQVQEPKPEKPDKKEPKESNPSSLEQFAESLNYFQKMAMIYFSNGIDVSGRSENSYFSWLSEGAQKTLVAKTGEGENSTRARVEFEHAVVTLKTKGYLLPKSSAYAGNTRKYWLEPTVAGYNLLDTIRSQDVSGDLI